MLQTSPGVRLVREAESVVAIRALHAHAAGHIGLAALLGDLPRRMRRAPLLPRVLGRGVSRAWAWNRHDQADRQWYPQGIATAHDTAGYSMLPEHRHVVATSWYSTGRDGTRRGARITFVDLDRRRYEHALLVVPSLDTQGRLHLEPLHVHAGGLVWAGPWLHVAATRRGFATAHVDDLMRVAGPVRSASNFGVRRDGIEAYGHRWVLPVRTMHRATTDPGHQALRYSFLGLDASADPPALLTGEYAAQRKDPRRLARFTLDPLTWQVVTDARAEATPSWLENGGVARMQGAVAAHGRLYVSTSRGPWAPGTLWTGPPGRLRPRRGVLPMGPEDLTYSPPSDELWTLTEHPRRRWIVTMRRDQFD
jgi:hypothetical protein